MKLPERVMICEVGTRDGFQIEPDFIATEQKIEVVISLRGRRPPHRGDVVRLLRGPAAARRGRGDGEDPPPPRDALRGAGAQRKGAVRAADAHVDVIHTVVSASESHNLANVNMTIADSMVKLRAVMAKVAEKAGIPVHCGVSVPSVVPSRATCRSSSSRAWWHAWSTWARRHRPRRHHGHGESASGRRPRSSTSCRGPRVEWTLHTHDTRAMAIPNILAAMELGVTNFDSSIGGLGGCPFAPGASGNVCTEDLVHCLHAMGVETGIDLDKLIAVSKRVQEIIGRALPGQITRRANGPKVPRSRRRGGPPTPSRLAEVRKTRRIRKRSRCGAAPKQQQAET